MSRLDLQVLEQSFKSLIAFIGDTVCLAGELVEPLPGFKPMKAMVS